MKIHRVIVTVYPPREADGYVGQVEEGYYTFEDGVVELVTHAGLSLHDRKGKAFSRKLEQGEDPHQQAGRLLKQYRESKNKGSRFNRPLNYQKLSIV